MGRPKVYDSFPYNGEAIVWLRLKVHDPVVDHFYIIESRYTFSGIRKDTLYCDLYKDMFQPYLHKITFIIIETYTDPLSLDCWTEKYKGLVLDWMIDPQAWYRENYQREAVLSYVQEKEEPFVLLVTDCDEIIRPSVVQELTEMYQEVDTPLFFKMDMYNYNFSWYKNVYWELGFVVTDRFLGSSMFQETYRGLLSICRMVRVFKLSSEVFSIENSGWHCSYFMSLEDIARKVRSFAHVELCHPQFLTHQHISACIRNGKEIFGRDVSGGPDMLLPGDYQGLPEGWETFQQELVETQQFT